MASVKKHEVDNIFNIFSIILSRKTILGKTNLSNWLNNVFTKKGEDLLISKKVFLVGTTWEAICFFQRCSGTVV